MLSWDFRSLRGEPMIGNFLEFASPLRPPESVEMPLVLPNAVAELVETLAKLGGTASRE